MKKLFNKVVTTFFLAVLMYSLVSLGSIGYDYVSNRHVLAEAKNIYYQEEDEREIEIPEEEGGMLPSFASLQSINQDIIGWIKVGDTAIDYPVLQSEDNQYYLDRNYKKEETRAGSIFLDHRNDVTDQPKHTILYGHRMKDASMFTGLTNFMEKDFFEDPPSMYYDTLYEQYDIEVFSAYQTHTDFYYIETEFQDDDTYHQFLEEIRSKSLYESDVELSSEDQIITLSTCDYSLHPTEGRLVVHGKLVKR
ncbi:class B sortase [Alkalicoccobacillus murimartini]|uniref:Sortase B n=1 Tax=Alkalicoccobacillus murimartini TaxID=171685 RepID=A0ABT9YJF9_9BACI|nr:class B sortase [Alkalicoccobacillus murimartini]MDQ0207748.1 sortase B [Alkalicoccobacillus murimartini]